MISFFDLWVSRRYLFPKMRDGFFSLITIFSFIGISLGVATLIIVMSVMNGFREELTSKVLGINGHLKVQLFNNCSDLFRSIYVQMCSETGGGFRKKYRNQIIELFKFN